MNASGIPTDGPDAVLFRVARRLRLPFSRSNITMAVATHPRPNSLLALVEVATSLGIKTTPGRADPSALSDLKLPAIVHFGGNGSPGGFGVLEEVSGEGFRIWDSAEGLHVVEREAFLSHWSGVVALVERAESEGARERGYLWRRLTEPLWGSPVPPAVSDGPVALPLRLILGAIAVALVGLGIAELPAAHRPEALALALLTGLGLAATVTTAFSVGDQTSSISARICARGKLVDCQSVLTSRYARIFGIPLSDLGIAFFGALLLLFASGAVGGGSLSPWLVAGVAYGFTLPFSAALVGAQIQMKQLCTLCLAVHLINVSSAVTSWFLIRDARWSLARDLPSLLFFVLAFSLVLFVVVPYFRKSAGLARLAARGARISASPFGGLADVLTESPAELRAADCAVPLGGPDDAHELVVFVHPSCGRCEPVLREARALADRGLVKAFVALAPRRPNDSDRAMCSALVAMGIGLGPDALVEAYARVKARLGDSKEDPITLVANELSLPLDRLEEDRKRAKTLVENAERVADAHVEGTPATFLNARAFRAPLAHLEFLLDHHPDLLESTRLRQGGPS